MRVGLIDVDGHNFPNLALMKLSAYHKSQGNKVDWCNLFEKYDIVYKAKVFTNTPDFQYMPQTNELIKGGTGYGLNNRLPEHIENQCPDYQLYPELTKKTAYGFLTRGCPRNCPFCIVSEKEGLKSYKVADLEQFWNGQKEIKLLDPNLIASKERFELLDQLIESNAYIDFTQGIDSRLLNDEIIEKISKLKIKMIHFAWDMLNDHDELIINNIKKFAEISKLGDRKIRCYVLTNYNTTLEQDLYRIYKLKEIGADPFIMIYNKDFAPKNLKQMARWVNNKFIFRSCERFEEYKLGV
jgi:hypothetical protein